MWKLLFISVVILYFNLHTTQASPLALNEPNETSISIPQFKNLFRNGYKEGQVAFIGGSIIDFFKWDGATIWGAFYGKLGAQRKGISYGRTTDLLRQIKENGYLNNLDPYLSVVLIGTNDLTDGVSESQVVANIIEIVRLIKENLKNSRILLLGLFPRSDLEIHSQIRRINVELEQFAVSENIYFADYEETFATGLGQLKPTLYWGDGTHLANMGYVRWAYDMEDLFSRVLSAPFQHKAVFLGDSLTGGWLENGLSVWNQDFLEVNSTNINVGNLGTDSLISRIRVDEILDGFTHTKVVVLNIGTHDITHGLNYEYIVNNTRRILDLVLERMPQSRILLLGLLPRGTLAMDAQAELVNLLIASFANGGRITFLNLRKQFEIELGSPIREYYTSDLLHLSPAGYRLLSNSISTQFHNLLKFDTYSNLNP